MQGLVASFVDAAWRAPDAAVAVLLLALPAFALRCLLRVALDRGSSAWTVVSRVAAGLLGLGAGVALAPLGWAALAHTRKEAVAAGLGFALVLLSAALPSVRERAPAAAGLLPLALVLLLSGLSGMVLLKAGFLRAAAGAPLVLVEVSGESRREIVRWAPLGLPPREEGLRAERLLLLRADGVPMGEAWIYGRTATLGGEAFRLRTLAGDGAWLGRFDTASNDAPIGDGRARLYPPQKVPVDPLARATLPAWWRERQRAWLRALGLERKALASPALPLVDVQGLPLRTTHRLVIREDGTLALP